MENIYLYKKRNHVIIKTIVLIVCFILVSQPSGKKETPNQRYSVGYMAPAAALADRDHQALLVDLELEKPGSPIRRLLGERVPDLFGVGFCPADQE